MCKIIDKIQLKCKGKIFPKVILPTISMLLLGFKGCNFALPLKGTKHLSSIASEPPKYQEVPDNGISSPEDGSSHFLGPVSYFKTDHNLGLIEIDPVNSFGVTGSKKRGVLFYASKALKDCENISLSNQEIKLSYFDGSTQVLSSFIEVDDEFLDRLSNENEVESLLHKDDCSRLAATCTTDFTLFSALDYGIESLNDANSIVLLEDSQDKGRFQDGNDAGFMVTKRLSACTRLCRQLKIS